MDGLICPSTAGSEELATARVALLTFEARRLTGVPGDPGNLYHVKSVGESRFARRMDFDPILDGEVSLGPDDVGPGELVLIVGSIDLELFRSYLSVLFARGARRLIVARLGDPPRVTLYTIKEKAVTELDTEARIASLCAALVCLDLPAADPGEPEAADPEHALARLESLSGEGDWSGVSLTDAEGFARGQRRLSCLRLASPIGAPPAAKGLDPKTLRKALDLGLGAMVATFVIDGAALAQAVELLVELGEVSKRSPQLVCGSLNGRSYLVWAHQQTGSFGLWPLAGEPPKTSTGLDLRELKRALTGASGPATLSVGRPMDPLGVGWGPEQHLILPTGPEASADALAWVDAQLRADRG